MIRPLRSHSLGLLAAVCLIAAALVTASGTGGCDSSYRPDDTPIGADGSLDGTTADDGATSDAGSEASACGADLAKDPKHCGRCGHDCLGGTCSAGKCQAVQLATVNAPLAHVLVNGSFVYVSTVRSRADHLGGIWRVPKSGGLPEAYVTLKGAEAMAVLGDTMYFVDSDAAENGTTHGGLYSCPLTGPVPCAPTLIAAAELPRTITIDKGRVLYTENALTGGLMLYEPPAAPVVLIANTLTSGFDSTRDLHVDGTAVFIAVTVNSFGPSTRARLIELLPDGGEVGRHTYTSPTATAGRLVASTDELFFSAYDYQDTTGGVVRRVSRSGGPGCDLGGAGNVRPHGLHADGAHVYWTNQGTGVKEPFVNGTVVSCERAGCCTTPEVLWTGNQPVALAGDADALYFTTLPTGGVWKIAKP